MSYFSAKMLLYLNVSEIYNEVERNDVMDNQIIKTVVLSSLYKAFPEVDPENSERSTFSCFKNEPLSFQFGFKLALQDGTVSAPFNLVVETELPISLYTEGTVPVSQTTDTKLTENYRAGLFYDILYPKKVNPKIETKCSWWLKLNFDDDTNKLSASVDSWKFAWFTVNEDGKTLKPGNYKIKLKLYSRRSGNLLEENEVNIEVIDAKLPKQTFIHTRWFQYDCLCDV